MTEPLIPKLDTWRKQTSQARGSVPQGSPTLDTADKSLAVFLVILSDQLNTDNPQIPVGVSVHFPRCLTEVGSCGAPYMCLQVHYKTSGKRFLDKSWKEGLGTASLFRVLHLPGPLPPPTFTVIGHIVFNMKSLFLSSFMKVSQWP